MCGTALPAFRRCNSVRDLCLPGDAAAGALLLKTAKSFNDLGTVVELSSLRVERADSQQCSSEDTARGSPTSGYEQLLRSRSPCAVLFASADEAEAAAVPLQQGAAPALLPPLQGKPPLPPGAFSGPLAALRGSPPGADEPPPPPALDTPFLESAAGFSVVEVQAAAAAARAAGFYPCAAQRSDSAASSMSIAAAAAEEAAGNGGDPIAAAAASQSAFAAAAASFSPPRSSSGGSMSGGLSAAVAAASAAAAAASPSVSPFARLSMQEHPSVMGGALHQPVPPPPGAAGSSAGSSPTGLQRSSASDLVRRGSLDGWGTSPHLSEGHAAEELFYRLNHARQTVEFVKRQANSFGQLSRGPLRIWEALELLNTLREYETALLGDPHGEGCDPDMPLLEHALQCAEACRAAFPEEECMHLAGLLAPLGKLLAHAKWGAEPQWAICGETFPVGCRFHPAVRHSQYFLANPDRRKRLYSSPTGVYREGCGLGGVLMSWGAGEYLHLVLRLNRVPLPPEALFCLRHQKLRCVFRPGAPYGELLSEFDRVQLPRLAKFQALCAYRRQPRAEPLLVPAGAAGGAAVQAIDPEDVPLAVNPSLRAYYDRLIAKYIPGGVLRW